MKTLVVKIPEALDAELTRQALTRRVTKSAIVRERLEARQQNEQGGLSVWDRMKDLVIAEDTLPRDLSSNPRHMKGYGKSRFAR